MAKGFLLSENMFDDDRIKLIESLPSGDETLVIYFRLMALACRSNSGGFIVLYRNVPYNEEMLATIFGRSLPKVRFAIKTLIEFGMISETNEGLKFEELKIIESHQSEPKLELTEPKKNEEKKKAKTVRTFEEDSVEMTLSKYLFELMRRNNPEAKEPNFQSWANEIRKMINIDKRKPEQIKNMIVWCQNDSFWKGNILSTKKLRDKYDQLKVRALEDWNKQQNRGGGRQSEIDDIFNRLEGGNGNDLPRSIEGY